MEPGRRSRLEDLADAKVQKAGLSGRDLSLFWEIVFGTVRWKRLLEWHLKKHLQKMAALPLPVRMILLTGSYQIIFLSRIPFFAAVDEAVKAVRKMGFPWAKGLVNAVLRKISSCEKTLPGDESFFSERCSSNFLNCLSVFSSHPHWMVKRWHEQLGKDKTVSVCVQNNSRPPVTIRVNTLKITRDELGSRFSEKGIVAVPGRLSPFSLILKGFRGRIEALPGFGQGLFQVQDESSQLVSMMLSPGPGMEVLDMCAGVGGKSTHIAALMEDRGRVICTDTSSRRLEQLAQNARRLEIRAIETMAPGSILNPPLTKHFDRVLVDAPCSGTGVIRRHPDIKWNRTPDMLKGFQELQLKILEDASRLLASSGILVYSVCSLEPEEGLEILANFLARNPSFSTLDASESLPPEAGELVTHEGFFRVLPGQYGMDGFFAAALTRDGNAEES